MGNAGAISRDREQHPKSLYLVHVRLAYQPDGSRSITAYSMLPLLRASIQPGVAIPRMRSTLNTKYTTHGMHMTPRKFQASLAQRPRDVFALDFVDLKGHETSYL
jgi:hypothetical protein